MNFGVIRDEAYGKYFLNERDRGWHTQKELEQVRDRRTFPHDLTTPEGKRKFEEHINDIVDFAPGSYAPYGEKFDFKAYYAEIGV